MPEPILTPPAEPVATPPVEPVAVPPVEPVAVVPPVEPVAVVPPVEPVAVVPPVDDGYEEFDLTRGENSHMSETDFNDFISYVESSDLTAEEAQAMLKDEEGIYLKAHNAEIDRYNARMEVDRADLLALPEFSDENREASFATITKVLDTFGSSELTALLKGPQGNNKHLAQFLLSIGKSMAPDKTSLVEGASVGSTPAVEDGSLRHLYPEHYTD